MSLICEKWKEVAETEGTKEVKRRDTYFSSCR
jgi:hypothetical protein